MSRDYGGTASKIGIGLVVLVVIIVALWVAQFVLGITTFFTDILDGGLIDLPPVELPGGGVFTLDPWFGAVGGWWNATFDNAAQWVGNNVTEPIYNWVESWRWW